MAVRTSLSLESARVRNCSLFFASACADSSEKAPARRIALLRRPPGGLEFGRAKQFELRHHNGTCRLGGRRRLRRRLQLGRQGSGPGPGIAQAALGQACRAGGTGGPGQVQESDGEAGRKTDDRSEDHEANVTTGCVTNGDACSPCLGCLHRPPSGVVTPEGSR